MSRSASFLIPVRLSQIYHTLDAYEFALAARLCEGFFELGRRHCADALRLARLSFAYLKYVLEILRKRQLPTSREREVQIEMSSLGRVQFSPAFFHPVCVGPRARSLARSDERPRCSSSIQHRSERVSRAHLACFLTKQQHRRGSFAAARGLARLLYDSERILGHAKQGFFSIFRTHAKLLVFLFP